VPEVFSLAFPRERVADGPLILNLLKINIIFFLWSGRGFVIIGRRITGAWLAIHVTAHITKTFSYLQRGADHRYQETENKLVQQVS
jgi:hypothetical protein